MSAAVSYRGTKKFRFDRCLRYTLSFPLLTTYKNLRDSRIITCGLLKVAEASEIDTNAYFKKSYKHVTESNQISWKKLFKTIL